MPGTGTLNESEITKKLEREGYSNVSLQRASGRQQMGGAAGTGQQAAGTGQQSTGSGQQTAGTEMYAGTATKDGKQVRFQVDSSGRVTKE